MTTEEKVKIILENYRDDIVSTNERSTVNDQAVILAKATQTILALIKPMSRKRLIKIIGNVSCDYPEIGRAIKDTFDPDFVKDLANAILAEWGKE